jgi:hypothetical protein
MNIQWPNNRYHLELNFIQLVIQSTVTSYTYMLGVLLQVIHKDRAKFLLHDYGLSSQHVTYSFLN